MNNKIVFMFGGQGSQYNNMAKELFKNNELFKETMLRLDKLFYKHIQESIIEKIYLEADSSYYMNNISYTHPAIFMIEYSLYEVLLQNDIFPDLLMGTSLGEITTACISQIITLDETIEIICKQVELIKNLCPKGIMISIFSDSNTFYENSVLFKNSNIVFANGKSNFTISLNKNQDVLDYLNSNNLIYKILPVEYAFHSPCIDNIRKQYENFLSRYSYKFPIIKIISSTGNNMNNLKENFFWDVIRKPILFNDAIESLKNFEKFFFIDLTPSSILANSINQGTKKNQIKAYSIITPFNKELQNIDKLRKKISN